MDESRDLCRELARKHDEAKTTMLMNTIGLIERRKIWQKNGIRDRWFHPLVSRRFDR